MFQWTLIDSSICNRREVTWDSVKAIFTEIQQSNYEVLLEISSNKFLVNMTTDSTWTISWFEIIAIKWFMELSKKIIDIIKKIICHLWEMCD
jgi:hypothetical protein